MEERAKVMTCCPETDFVPFVEKFPENHHIIFFIQSFAQHSPGFFLDFFSFEFSNFSNRSATFNSSFADCPVLTDCSLVFAFLAFEGFVLASLGEDP